MTPVGSWVVVGSIREKMGLPFAVLSIIIQMPLAKHLVTRCLQNSIRRRRHLLSGALF